MSHIYFTKHINSTFRTLFISSSNFKDSFQKSSEVSTPQSVFMYQTHLASLISQILMLFSISLYLQTDPSESSSSATILEVHWNPALPAMLCHTLLDFCRTHSCWHRFLGLYPRWTHHNNTGEVNLSSSVGFSL